jgi:16S rRNA G966 N2-methylase RsmD
MTVNPIEIKINSEYSNLVNPLSDLEYEALKNSIKENGLHYPIIVNSKGEILDGHHRYDICIKLGIIPMLKSEIKYFVDINAEKKFVIEINLKRRQLNDYQKAELAYKLEGIYKEQARLRQLLKLKNVKDKLPSSLWSNDHNENNVKNHTINGKEENKGRVIDIISKNNDLSPKTYQRAKTIIENGSEEVKEKLRVNKTTISKEYEKIRRDRKRQELLSQLNIQSDKNKMENNGCKIFLGDLIDRSTKEIADSSIDLIFTDPPYGKEYLNLYQELAKVAIRILKPGGNLVFFVGHIILDEVFNIFHNHNSDLKYWWTFAVKHSGRHQKIYPRYVFVEWKPLLWYVKGDQLNDLVISNTIGDYIESTAPSKVMHPWEQSMVEAEHIIKNLTLENQMVLDPMMGTGTTGIAALNLNRKFIGIEEDKEIFEIAKARITKYRAKNSITKQGIQK